MCETQSESSSRGRTTENSFASASLGAIQALDGSPEDGAALPALKLQFADLAKAHARSLPADARYDERWRRTRPTPLRRSSFRLPQRSGAQRSEPASDEAEATAWRREHRKAAHTAEYS